MNTLLIVIIIIIILWEVAKLAYTFQSDPCTECERGEYVHINDLAYCDVRGHMKDDES